MAEFTIADFADEVDLLYREMYADVFERPQMWGLIFGDGNAPAPQFKIGGKTNMSLFQKRDFGVETNFAELAQYTRFPTTVNVAKYTGKFRIVEDLVLGAQAVGNYDMITGRVTDFGNAYLDTLDFIHWSYILDGVATNKLGNGEYLFSVAQPIKSGGTRINLQTGQLTSANLATAIATMGSYPDHHGIRREWRPKYLVVGETLRPTALQVTQAEFRGAYWSDPLLDKYMKQLQIITVPLFDQVGSGKYWFLCDEPARTHLKTYWMARSKMQLDIPDTRTMIYSDRFINIPTAVQDEGIYMGIGTV